MYSAAEGYCVAWDIVPLWVAVSCEAAGYRGSEGLCCPSSDTALVAECLRVRQPSRGAVLAAAVTGRHFALVAAVSDGRMRSIRRSPQRPRGSTSSAPLARQGMPRASAPSAGDPTAALRMMPAIHRTRAPCGARTAGRARCTMHAARGGIRRAARGVTLTTYSVIDTRDEQNATCDVHRVHRDREEYAQYRRGRFRERETAARTEW